MTDLSERIGLVAPRAAVTETKVAVPATITLLPCRLLSGSRVSIEYDWADASLLVAHVDGLMNLKPEAPIVPGSLTFAVRLRTFAHERVCTEPTGCDHGSALVVERDVYGELTHTGTGIKLGMFRFAVHSLVVKARDGSDLDLATSDPLGITIVPTVCSGGYHVGPIRKWGNRTGTGYMCLSCQRRDIW